MSRTSFVTFDIDSTLPKAIQAATLAMGVLIHTRVSAKDPFDWRALEQALTSGDQKTKGKLHELWLTDEHKALLTHEAVLLVSTGPPRINIAMCNRCKEVLAYSGTALTAKCVMTQGCTGTHEFKSKAPKKVTYVPDD